MRIKQIFIVLTIVILSSIISYRLGVLAQMTGALKSIVEPGSMITEASYIIFTDGTNVYARNGDTGQIEFNGIDASQVIQSSINSLTSGRTWSEKIVLKDDFSISSTIHIPSYTEIELQGKITRTADVPIYALDEKKGIDASQVVNFIHGGILDGSGYSTDMIEIYNVKGSSFKDMSLRNFKGNGVYMDGRPTATYKSFYNLFDNLRFGYLSGSHNTRKGFFYLTDNAIDNIIINCLGSASGISSGQRPYGFIFDGTGGYRLVNNHFDNTHNFALFDGTKGQINNIHMFGDIIDLTIQDGLYFNISTNGMTDITITDSYFINIPTNYDFIYIQNTGVSGWLNDMVVTGSTSKGTSHRYCVERATTGQTSRLMFAHNRWSSGVSGVYNNVPTNYIEDDGAYVTENSGTATISAGTSVIVNHGLVGTPTRVMITPRSTGYGTIAVTARDGTTFTITVTSSGTYTIDWYAEV